IVRALHRHERVNVLCQSDDVREGAIQTLASHGVGLDNFTMHVVPTDRGWLRDTAPTGVYGPRGFEWIGWDFNGWAKYPNYERDRRVKEAVAGLTGEPLVLAMRPDEAGPLVLEGGGIEGNGAGILLV